jgi:hypothetical protein
MSIIADRIVPITVHAKRAAKDDLGIKSRRRDLDDRRALTRCTCRRRRVRKALAVKTIIVPTSGMRWSQPGPDTGLHLRSFFATWWNSAEWSWSAFNHREEADASSLSPDSGPRASSHAAPLRATRPPLELR